LDELEAEAKKLREEKEELDCKWEHIRRNAGKEIKGIQESMKMIDQRLREIDQLQHSDKYCKCEDCGSIQMKNSFFPEERKEPFVCSKCSQKRGQEAKRKELELLLLNATVIGVRTTLDEDSELEFLLVSKNGRTFEVSACWDGDDFQSYLDFEEVKEVAQTE